MPDHSLNPIRPRVRLHSIRSWATCLAAVLALAFIAGSDPAAEPENLIVNGDFETPEAPDRNLEISKDQLTGWTIERGNVDTISTFWPAKHGKQSLDLNGSTGGVISQSVETRPGQWYRLTFFYAGNPDEDAPDKTRAAEVQWGDKRIATLKPKPGTLEDMNWQPAEYVVQAKDAHTTLLFIAVNEGPSGVALDDVSLVACDAPVEGATTRAAEKRKPSTTSPAAKAN